MDAADYQRESFQRIQAPLNLLEKENEFITLCIFILIIRKTFSLKMSRHFDCLNLALISFGKSYQKFLREQLQANNSRRTCLYIRLKSESWMKIALSSQLIRDSRSRQVSYEVN